MRFQDAAVPALAVLLIGSGCGKSNDQSQTQPPGSGVRPLVADVFGVVRRDNKVPNFSWKDSTGKTVDFDSFRGKATLINFWATWCVPCKKELPDLVALSSELAGRDVKVLGISTDRGANVESDVGTFVRDHGIPYQVLISSEDLEEAFGNVRAIPTTFLIDADGNIVQTFIGARSKDIFAQAIAAVVK